MRPPPVRGRGGAGWPAAAARPRRADVFDTRRYELEVPPPLSLAWRSPSTATQQFLVPGPGTVLVDPVLLLAALAGVDGEARFELPLPDQPILGGMVIVAQAAGSVGGVMQRSDGVVSRICDGPRTNWRCGPTAPFPRRGATGTMLGLGSLP